MQKIFFTRDFLQFLPHFGGKMKFGTKNRRCGGNRFHEKKLKNRRGRPMTGGGRRAFPAGDSGRVGFAVVKNIFVEDATDQLVSAFVRMDPVAAEELLVALRFQERTGDVHQRCVGFAG